MNNRIASVSLDLDNQWTYMKIHGDAGWDQYPSYLEVFVPHILNVLDDLKLKITFFVVGKDASIDSNESFFQELVQRGHEIGNHSFHHESWLHTYSKPELEYEILQTEAHIERITGQVTTGFRGPGFSWSPQLFEILHERGYQYDASTLPTYIGPLARMYYFWTSNLSKEERETRKGLFGSFKDGFRSLKPYYWKLNNGDRLMELPVTTIPVIKTPFHFSYLLYLSGISSFIMNRYLDLAIQLCKWTGTQPSYLLHPLDLIGGDQIPELKFFPGMNISSSRKIEVFNHVMHRLSAHFKLTNMSTHVKHIQKTDLARKRWNIVDPVSQ